MSYNYQQIRHVQLEISTHCNAACPQCSRNFYGGPTIENLPLIIWDLAQAQQALPKQFVQQLDSVYFCGTHGDPMTNKHIVEICKWLKQTNSKIKLALHTNGSVGKKEHYAELAPLMEFIAFGIDGLEDTNHIYRRHCDWNTIMTNVKNFISNGGKSFWDFIVFEYNQHQISQAEMLSKQLGFVKFNVKKTARFFDYNYKFKEELTVLNEKKQKIFVLRPATDLKYVNQELDKLKNINLTDYRKSVDISCHYQKKQSIYIGADGYVFPCGWLHDRLYGVDAVKSQDHLELLEMMQETSGAHMANCFQTPLEQIINGAWFNKIKDNWSTKRLTRCVLICGQKINIIQEQNKLVNYDDEIS